MAAVHLLDAYSGLSVLDVCAAPGMKGLYLNSLYDCLEYRANDLSGDRLARLGRLFKKHGKEIDQITKYDARFIDRAYATESFDRILLDAPCSGEGVILGGNTKLLETWSPAKVKRLQQLQIGILKSAWKLLKPGGRLIYATCTLNKNENERAIKKALGATISVREGALSLSEAPQLRNKEAWRILPSENSIGFFVAALDKSVEEE
jgi:16S rRNA C967 or C1407 C5-methylase (RsmB/RsmF family)